MDYSRNIFRSAHNVLNFLVINYAFHSFRQSYFVPRFPHFSSSTNSSNDLGAQSKNDFLIFLDEIKREELIYYVRYDFQFDSEKIRYVYRSVGSI